ncbi:hypothetical protein [Alloalcanivorax gelatiniphagus]|uniref:Lipoprotein n=1 Tax=Alloalcanivorax gelatiniphagus TaxID=1194167 RepID=A0ABY2XI44_9GAMM|nr:hypothetical protein [Alloalcanivorax gelatiniphagus]TMW11430.1 hypothetical protein FGS76_15400 [Alloalcanivorax gelatiniphagus]|tara:strand:+ start:6612 stop:7226 length:615 start_codon:yes stop_codon:yes gene_type:complete
MTVPRRTVSMLFPLLMVLALAGCATPSEVVSGWNAPSAERPRFQNLFVIALINDEEDRVAVEDALGKALEGRVGQVHLAHRELAAAANGDDLRQRVEKAVDRTGADGVLVVSFLKAEVRADYVPPRLQGFGPSLGADYDTVYSPGYYQESLDYYMQSTLYQVGRDSPVWQAQSRVINPTSLDSGVRGFAGDLAKRLQEDGALRR